MNKKVISIENYVNHQHLNSNQIYKFYKNHKLKRKVQR